MSCPEGPAVQPPASPAEEEREQAIRLDAIARFAGGIAHDFNNYLTAIIGYANLLLDSGGLGEAQRRDTDAILMAAQQAAGLTRQLLALSRKQFMLPRVVNPNDLLSDMESRLTAILGEGCRLALHLDPTAASVRLDRSQMTQALLELASYCKSTMPAGGRVTIRTCAVPADGKDVSEGAAADGLAGTCIKVAADGPGLDHEALLRIFEPFSAANGRHGRAALGLAMVHGIVQQCGGSIRAESLPGQGVSFHIHLPPAAERVPVQTPALHEVSRDRRGPVILLVDDEDLLRSMAARVLERAGFQVLTACDGEDALTVCSDHPGQIRLIVTDVVMPRMGGLELAARVRARDLQVKVLFMSGFTETSIASGAPSGSAHFLQKPFMPEGLLAKVKEVLGS